MIVSNLFKIRVKLFGFYKRQETILYASFYYEYGRTYTYGDHSLEKKIPTLPSFITF